jgi:hypothetical protein
MVFKGLQPCFFFGSAEKKEKNNFVRGRRSPVRRTAGSASGLMLISMQANLNKIH